MAEKSMAEKRVEELESEVARLCDIDKETYRDRLDRMVGSVAMFTMKQANSVWSWSTVVNEARTVLSAIDAEVEKR